MKRTIAIFGYYFNVQYYDSLRTFFNNVAAGDQDAVVLRGEQ
jgi:hypothetical protein